MRRMVPRDGVRGATVRPHARASRRFGQSSRGVVVQFVDRVGDDLILVVVVICENLSMVITGKKQRNCVFKTEKISARSHWASLLKNVVLT